MTVDITDERIFGNDAGDDESLDILNHYFVERPEFGRFYDKSVLLRIVKARKGVGKSSLLRRTASNASKDRADDLFISCKGTEISPDFSDPKVLQNPILAWQKAICARVNRAIGAKIKWAATDDQIMLVEAAELDGFRGRNLLSALVDRFSPKVSALGVDASRQRIPVQDDIQLLSRVGSGSNHVWLIVDDIDATFRNDDVSRLALASFFSACRDLGQKVQGLVIRLAVRTDVWTILRGFDESLDKCEQYVFNLRWNADQVAYILKNKLHAYFDIINPSALTFKTKNEESRKDEALISIFPLRYSWGAKSIASSKYLGIYSQGRPRWTAKLCRSAAMKAYHRGHDKIEEVDVKAVLKSYASDRRMDLVGEHSHEYEDFNGLLQIFSGWKRRFTTQELLSRISSNHLKKDVKPNARSLGAVELAYLLFRAGFLVGVKDSGRGKSEYYEHEDRPGLLTARANLDEGCEWEIPMYLRLEFGV